MKHIMTLRHGINVMPLSLALRRNPQLWNQHSSRRVAPGSPHLATDDIWVRYARDATSPAPHDSVWYASSDVLPEVKEIVYPLMAMVKGERLGGVLITRIPAGHSVAPHVDLGWHASQYQKFAVQIESHQQQAFCYSDGDHVTAPGDVFWFDNSKEHWVTNNSPVSRITMIVCIQTDTMERIGA